jgi:hypothetical protein
MNEGGDKRAFRAKADIAKREQQIVALKLRGIAVPEIARVIGISPRAVHAAFNKALRRQTEEALDAWHRTELGGLAMEAANIWRLMDLTDNKNNWKAQASLEDRLMRIHIRRAKLLGLDAPTKLDVSGIYRTGADEMSEERRETHRAWQAMPLEEQARIYDAFDAARARLNAPIETTATVTIGPDNRNPDVEPPAADDEL